MEESNHRPLFNWQEGDSFDAFVSQCPWCETATAVMRGNEDDDITTHRACKCPLCGWFSSRYIWMSRSSGMFEGSYHNAILKRFPRSRRLEVAAKAVTTRLRTVSAGARSKGWSTLKAAAQEELRNRKYKTVLAVIAESGNAMIVATPGREIFMFELTGLQTPESLTVRTVYAILGVGVDWQTGRARVVTTPLPSTNKPVESWRDAQGHDISLRAATRLCKAVRTYTPRMPPLEKLDESARARIISSWKPAHGWHLPANSPYYGR